MSDMEKVGRIVQEMRDMRLSEFKEPKTRKCIEFITDEIFSREGLSKEKARDMTYIELAHLIDNVGGNPKYDDPDHDSWAVQLYQYGSVESALILESRVSEPVRLFMDLKLHHFCEYMELEHMKNSRHYREDQPAMNSLIECIRESCSKSFFLCTIRLFLSAKTKILNQAWYPMESPYIYARNIRNAHRDIGRVLVSSFHMAFPENV